MKRPFSILVGIISIFFSAACGVSMTQPDPDVRLDGATAAPARDGEAAVQEEFAAAERAGTATAWLLFATRHPEHALARIALERAQRLETDRVDAP